MSDVAYRLEEAEEPHPQREEPFVAPLPRVTIQAFCDSQEMAEVLEFAGEDRRMARTHLTVQMGGLAAAIGFYQDTSTPNLIIVETTDGARDIVPALMRLAEVCDATTKVIVVGHINDVLLYRDLVNRGVSEYLVAPLQPLQLIQAIGSLYTDPDADPVGRVVAFIGAKGGCGSSTIAHNTGWAIAKNYATDVVITDLDLAFGTAALDFNQDPPQGVAEAVFSPDRLDDVLLDRLLAKCTDRLSLFAAPSTLDRDYDLASNAFDKVLEVVRANVPLVVLDVPHLWTGWVKEVLTAVDEVVVTAAPDLANLRNAKNIVDFLKQKRPNDRPPHLVINGLGLPKRPEISPGDFADALELAPVAIVPFEPQLFGTAANNGQMIEEIASGSKISGLFDEMSSLLTGKAEAKTKPKSLLAPLLGKLSRKKG